MTIRNHFDTFLSLMKNTKLLTWCLLILLAASSSSFAEDTVRFQCQLRDIDTQSEGSESLNFVRDVKTCDGTTGGFCFIPIDHLKTKIGCRDFTASFDENSEPKTLDVTLWSYCGAAPTPTQATSQTVSLPPDSKYFQLTAEWGRTLTILKCTRL